MDFEKSIIFAVVIKFIIAELRRFLRIIWTLHEKSITCCCYKQGSYGPWKSWKTLKNL